MGLPDGAFIAMYVTLPKYSSLEYLLLGDEEHMVSIEEAISILLYEPTLDASDTALLYKLQEHLEAGVTEVVLSRED